MKPEEIEEQAFPSDAAVTERLNRLFADSELAEQQAREARELDASGTDWSDERW